VKITHHLDDATIVALAAGTLDEALAAVAASHAAWCLECRSAVRKAETMGGAVLGGLEAEAVSSDCRAKTMASLDGAVVRPFPGSPRSGELPLPLQSLTGLNGFGDIAWKAKAPGIAMADVKLSPGAKGHLYLLKIGPGKAMPEHGHGGEELTMILSGCYSDKFGTFARGDVADLDEAVEHTPIVGGDEPCICLVAAEAPTKFKSFLARLAQPYLGI
jgi:putative transcriptional regulator